MAKKLTPAQQAAIDALIEVGDAGLIGYQTFGYQDFRFGMAQGPAHRHGTIQALARRGLVVIDTTVGEHGTIRRVARLAPPAAA